MSGIEIAGLVLGALPLLISALEHYRKGLRPVKTMAYAWKKQLEHLISRLKEQKFWLRQNIKVLLAAALPNEDSDLTKVDVIAFTRRDEVSWSIEQYLNDKESLDYFKDILRQCEENLMTIATQLQHVKRPPKVSVCKVNQFWNYHLAPASLDFGAFCAKLGAEGARGCFPELPELVRPMEKQSKMLTFYEQGTTDLETLIMCNPKTGPLHFFKTGFNFTMKQKEIEQTVNNVKDCNRSLSDFVKSEESISNSRLSQVADRSTGMAKNLVASFHKIWEHASTLHCALSNCWSASCASNHQTMLFLDPRAAHPRNKTLLYQKEYSPVFRLALAANCSNVDWQEGEVAIIKLKQPNSKKEEVLDFCHRLTQTRPVDKAWKLDVTGDKKLYCCKHNTETCDAWLQSCQYSTTTSLGQYLRSDKSKNLMPKETIQVALTLAASMIQLYQTQWSTQVWTKDFINICPQTSTDRIDWTKTYVAATHPPPSTLPRPNVKEDLLSLGIMLLELWERQTFESWITSISATVTDDYYSRMGLAVRWLDTVQERWPVPDYGYAVSSCVRFSFEGVQQDWSHPGFRKMVCEKVIGPLQDTCRIVTPAT